MLVVEAMNKDVETARSSVSIKKIAKQMSERRIGSVVIISGSGELEGIITERDVMADVVAEGLDPETTTAEQIMTKDVIIIDPSKDLETAADLMTQNKIKKLPVVMNGKLVGIITASDLIAYEEKLVEKIAHLMTSSRITGIGG